MIRRFKRLGQIFTRFRIRLKRYLFNRKGHHVHSPYAYHMLTEIIDSNEQYDVYPNLWGNVIGNLDMQPYKQINIFKSRRQLELIFRLALNSTTQECTIINAEKKSFVQYYINAAKPDIPVDIISGETFLDRIYKKPTLIIVERIDEQSLAQWIAELFSYDGRFCDKCLIIFNLNKRDINLIYKIWKEVETFAEKNVVIDLYDMGLLKIDKTLTPGKYRGYI